MNELGHHITSRGIEIVRPSRAICAREPFNKVILAKHLQARTFYTPSDASNISQRRFKIFHARDFEDLDVIRRALEHHNVYLSALLQRPGAKALLRLALSTPRLSWYCPRASAFVVCQGTDGNNTPYRQLAMTASSNSVALSCCLNPMSSQDISPALVVCTLPTSSGGSVSH